MKPARSPRGKAQLRPGDKKRVRVVLLSKGISECVKFHHVDESKGPGTLQSRGFKASAAPSNGGRRRHGVSVHGDDRLDEAPAFNGLLQPVKRVVGILARIVGGREKV